MTGQKMLPIFSYESDSEGYPTGRLTKRMMLRYPHPKGEHDWVCACDSKGAEVFVYCELCGKKRR